jgi:gliding motility-associated-like protein
MLNLAAPLTTTEYFVRFEGSCDSSAFTGTQVYIYELTAGGPDSAYTDRHNVCPGDGDIVLSYGGGDPGSSGSAVWYSDSALTVKAGTGNDLTVAAPDSTTTYFVRFESKCDTTLTASVTISILTIPDPAFAEKPEKVCINGPLYRYVAIGQPGSLFAWNITDGIIETENNDTIWVDWGPEPLTGVLELTETTSEGCESAPVSLEVMVSGPLLDMGEDIVICYGDSETVMPEGEYASYQWHDGSTGPQFTTDQEGWIILEVADSSGCRTTDSLYLSLQDLPVVDLGSDTSICSDDGLVLDAGPGWEVYTWSTGDISQQITLFNNGRQEIWAVVEDIYGCTGSDTIIIEECDLSHRFKFPTGITPNGDGVNDVWNIEALKEFSQAVVEIFDQWGTLVWRSEPGYSEPWDGRNMHGRAVPVDSYHFVIHFNDGSDERMVGYVTVIK